MQYHFSLSLLIDEWQPPVWSCWQPPRVELLTFSTAPHLLAMVLLSTVPPTQNKYEEQKICHYQVGVPDNGETGEK